MPVNCDDFGFFNGVYAIEQGNWAKYWEGIVPDGVIAGQGNELEVFAQSDGLKVHVKTGSAIVSGHRAWITSEKEIEIAENLTGSARTDGIFVRVNYGNDGESTLTLIAKTGSVATHRTGAPDDLLLAAVTVPANAVTIAASAVIDRRYIFALGHDGTNVEAIAVSSYSATVTPLNDHEYRANTDPVKNITIKLPVSPTQTYMTCVCFRTHESVFNGVTFKKTDGTSASPKCVGDTLTLANRKYTLIIWYDGAYYWCAAKAAGI